MTEKELMRAVCRERLPDLEETKKKLLAKEGAVTMEPKKKNGMNLRRWGTAAACAAIVVAVGVGVWLKGGLPSAAAPEDTTGMAGNSSAMDTLGTVDKEKAESAGQDAVNAGGMDAGGADADGTDAGGAENEADDTAQQEPAAESEAPAEGHTDAAAPTQTVSQPTDAGKKQETGGNQPDKGEEPQENSPAPADTADKTGGNTNSSTGTGLPAGGDGTAAGSETAGTETAGAKAMTDVLADLYAGADLDEDTRSAMAGYETVTLSKEDGSVLLGTDKVDFVDGIYSAPMMSSVPYQCILIRLADGQDGAAAVQAIRDSANPRKWICVEAESVVVARKGQVVLFVMANADVASALETAFGAMTVE